MIIKIRQSDGRIVVRCDRHLHIISTKSSQSQTAVITPQQLHGYPPPPLNPAFVFSHRDQNRLKRIGVRWLHVEEFSVIQV